MTRAVMKRLSLAPDAIARSRSLRATATETEHAMWRLLKENFPLAHFRRQVPLGPYFADFASHRARLVIEVDGGQHGEAIAYDAARTGFLGREGHRVIRFWNNDVLANPEGVATLIQKALPPCGEGLGWGPDAPASAEETSSALPADAPTSRPPHKGEEADRQPMVGVN